VTDLQPTGADREHTLGYLLWEMSARMTVLGDAALADTALSMPALGTLQRIVDRPGVTVAELARSGPRTSQAISQIVARLERLGYVRRALATEGRGVGLHLTEAGEQARRHGLRLEVRFESELAEELGAERYDSLCALLEQSRDVVRGLDERRRATAQH
jgi:DNA-binding MarR family transcriptional regulator